MKGLSFFRLIFFILLFMGGLAAHAQNSVTYSSNGTCSPDQADYFTTASCWTRTGNCTPPSWPVTKKTFPPPAAPPLEVGDTITITEGEYPDVDEEGDSITVKRIDYIITAEGDILDLEAGETYTVALGDRLIKHNGTELIAELRGVAPDPIYEIQGSAGCPVTFEINDPINTGNIHLRAHVTLKVNSGGALNLNNLTQDREIATSIIVDGGELVVRGSLIPTAARNNQPKTRLNITLLNNGKFDVLGLIDLKNNTHLVIDGDGTSYVETRNISFNQGVRLDIKPNGGLIVHGDTRFNGNASQFNIEGYFETKSLTVAGGIGLELNTLGNSTVKIHEDVSIRGDATKITFGGESVIEVGGDFEVSGGATTNFKDDAKVVIEGSVNVNGNSNLNVSGNAQMDIVGGCEESQPDCEGGIILNGGGKFNVTGEAEVYVCGQRPPPNENQGVAVTVFCEDAAEGEPCATYTGCRILPVNIERIEAKLDVAQRITVLSWSTAKEWENSHFEIERSLGGLDSFEKIGEVVGMGWSDRISSYTFADESLPLKGGNVIYRLKQVDFNGKYEYSEMMAVRVPAIHVTSGVWRAFPNPTAGGRFHLELVDATQYQNEEITMRVLSSTFHTPVRTYKTVQELDQAAYELMASAPRGLWILELQWGNKVEHLKVMKK